LTITFDAAEFFLGTLQTGAAPAPESNERLSMNQS
jgi:hypothetical protein